MNSDIRRIAMAAVMAALICIATVLFVFPLPGGGYANLGDCLVIAAAWLLGPLWGAAASGIGAALADILSGYGMFAPATLVIKAVMAAVVIYTAKAVKKYLPNQKAVQAAVSATGAELCMVAGYFLFECFLYGASMAAVNLLGNGAQACVGIVAGTALTVVLRPLLKKLNGKYSL